MRDEKGGDSVAKHNDAVKTLFEQQYNDYQQEIVRFCLSRLHGNLHATEDCTQDTFLVLYKRMKAGEEIQHPRAFLYKTAYNITMKYLQRRQKQLQREAAMEEAMENLPDEQFHISEQLDYEQLQNLLTSLLNEQEQQLYALYFEQELPVKDIAAMLQLAPHTCTMRLSRLRHKIKEAVAPYLKGDDNDGNG